MAIPFINKPLRNYDGLCIICGDDITIGSDTTSMFRDINKRLGEEDNMELRDRSNEIPINNEDNSNHNSSPPINSSPTTFATIRPQHAPRRGNISLW